MNTEERSSSIGISEKAKKSYYEYYLFIED